MGAYGYVPSCQALNVMASQEPDGHGACPALKSPLVARRVRYEQSGDKILSVHNHGGRLGVIRS
jgi:hypothetical protein